MAIYTYDQLKQLWIDAGGSPQTADSAAKVALATSKGDSSFQRSNADGTISRGLWGINSTRGKSASIEPMESARGAVALSQSGRDWDDWIPDWPAELIKGAVTTIANPASAIGELLGIDQLPRLAYNMILVGAGVMWMIGGLLLIFFGSRRFKAALGFARDTVGTGIGFGVGASVANVIPGIGGDGGPGPAPAAEPAPPAEPPRGGRHRREAIEAEVLPTPLAAGGRAHRQGDGGTYRARHERAGRISRRVRWVE
jgi:hypothetical protein